MNLFIPTSECEVIIYTIQFESHDTNFRRECVVPKDSDENLVKMFIAKTLHIKEEIIKILRKEKAFVLDKFIDQNFEKDHYEFFCVDCIDFYWIDVVEYVVEITKNGKAIDFSVIVGVETEEREIQKLFQNYFPKENILVDFFKNAWLMRSPEFLLTEVM